MSHPRVIGLTGHMQAGKDSVGQILSKKYGYKRIALADKVRELVLEINPLVRCADEFIEIAALVSRAGWEAAKKYPDVRCLLQRTGNGARTILDQDIWIRPVLEEIKTRPNSKYVITDIRYQNEAQIFRCYGEIWKIIRPGFDGDEHPSEKEIDLIRFDRMVGNIGTLTELETLVNLIMRSYK